MNTWKESNLLREQAKSRSSIQNTIESTSYVRLEHLAKLFYYRDVDTYDFRVWVTSARKGIETLSLLKGSKATLDSKTIYAWAFGEYLDNWDNLIRDIIESINFSYKDLPDIKNLDTEKFKNFCSDYFLEASNKLSTKRNFSSWEANDLIKELLIKYPLEEKIND